MYRKNTAGQHLGFRLVSATTGADLTGATVGVKRVIDGGTYEDATGSVTEKGGGCYDLALSQGDTNGNQISFRFAATGAITVEKTIATTAADPTSATNFGLTNLDGTITSRLAPTVAGRTLDVTTTGEAGIDWGNIGSPTATNNLSGTSTSAVSGAVGSVTGAVGSVTGNVGGIATGGIVAASFATDAITADALAAGAVTKIQTGLGALLPTNFATLAIDTSGQVVLGPTGLDAISVADPGGVAEMTTFPKLVVALWRRFYKKTTLASNQFKTYADNGTSVNTTQTATGATGLNQSLGAAS
jgi:hypothetical protein